jgi:hypothetical protein
MKKIKILKIILPIGIGIIILILWISSLNKEHYGLNFRGNISDIKTDEKGYPYVKINKRETWYPIPQAIDSDILVGDSICKKTGESEIKLYRNGKLINSFY